MAVNRQIAIHENYSLLELNTLKVRSVADYYVEISELEGLNDALNLASNKALPIKVLGGGSNLVMMDNVTGLVVRYINGSISVIEETDDEVLVEVGAGVVWHDFVMESLSKGWFGLENLALIPGSVGASPVQNIGAYGVEVKQFIVSVNGVYLASQKGFSLQNHECLFGYRESIFKQALNDKTCITSVVFKLFKTPSVNISYGPLKDRAEREGLPSPLTLAKWVIDVRQSKLPDPVVLPNAGSFFKNPVISSDQFAQLKRDHPNVPGFAVDGQQVKVAAGWLIDQLGLKGKSFGHVKVHDLQALVLVNKGGTGAEVIEAANLVRQEVLACYGIDLEQEPRIFQ